MTNEPINYAVIGCGNFTRYAWPRMSRARGWELVGAVEPDAGNRKAFRDASGLGDDRVFADDKSLYDTVRPEVVFVHSPLGSHAENCRRALEAGCHVCCQKPFVDDLATGMALVALSRETRRWISVAQTSRLSTTTQAIHKAIQGGRIGTPAFGHFTVYRDRMRNPEVFTRGESWPVIHACGIHHVDMFRYWLGGRVRRVSFRGIDCSWNRYDDPGVVTGWLEMESGVVMTYLASFVSVVATDPARHPYEDKMIQGSEGALHWNGPWDRGPVELIRGDAASPEEILPLVEDGADETMVALMDSLAASIRDAAPLFCPAEDNLWSLAALFAAEESANRGGTIVDAIEWGRGN